METLFQLPGMLAVVHQQEQVTIAKYLEQAGAQRSTTSFGDAQGARDGGCHAV